MPNILESGQRHTNPMKSNRFSLIITVTFGLAAIATIGSAETPNTATGATAPSRVAANLSPEAADAQWADIKDVIYDLRPQFFTGLKRLEARVDDQIRELTAKRAAMTSTANTHEWDFAMKEMGDARSYLTSMGVELSKASPETWNQVKDKVGKAWVRTQDAYAKVKASTTS